MRFYLSIHHNKTIENADENRDFCKHFVFIFAGQVKTKTFENGDVNSVIGSSPNPSVYLPVTAF